MSTLYFTYVTLWCPNKADSQLVFSDDSGQQVTSAQNLLNAISTSGEFPSVEPPKPTQNSVKVHVLSSTRVDRHLALVSTHIRQWCRNRLGEGGQCYQDFILSVCLAAASGPQGSVAVAMAGSCLEEMQPTRIWGSSSFLQPALLCGSEMWS